MWRKQLHVGRRGLFRDVCGLDWWAHARGSVEECENSRWGIVKGMVMMTAAILG
jgi:hypothetical protein